MTETLKKLILIIKRNEGLFVSSGKIPCDINISRRHLGLQGKKRIILTKENVYENGMQVLKACLKVLHNGKQVKAVINVMSTVRRKETNQNRLNINFFILKECWKRKN